MRKLYSRINRINTPTGRRPSVTQAVFRLLLASVYLGLAALWHGPGVSFHLMIAWRAIRLARTSMRLADVYKLLVSPMDSFRYFEFDFFWRSASTRESLGNYLDVSSPRLFSWRILADGKSRRAVIANPDKEDLALTRKLINTLQPTFNCELHCLPVSGLDEPLSSFDTVVCISVLEHIPLDEAQEALLKMWQLVKPGGGRLLLSVPCAREAFEEYVDWNEYGVLPTRHDGFVFGQRFYDQQMLIDQIHAVVGRAERMAIFGEKVAGTFLRNRSERLQDFNYPFWREPFVMATQYRLFDSIECLPGLGVIAFEFVKP